MFHTQLAVDGGQTEIKLRIIDKGNVAERRLPGVQTHLPVLPQLAAAIGHAASIRGTGFDVVSIGTTGLTNAEHDAGALRAMLQPGVAHLNLAHDSVSSYLGALGDRPGAVVVAGTGVVTLAVGTNNTARVDGWGNIMGDSGSAYWMGQQALSAVMRAHDGRGPQTALTGPVRERWPELEEAYIQLQAARDKISVVASFGKEVSRYAQTDPVAALICDLAGKELAHSAAAALRRTGQADASQASVACLGGVFAGARVRSAFTAELASLVPGAQLVEPAGNGLDGIRLMGGLTANHPLRSMISSV
ncbi:N-acetylglucosamine kinase-like BadF-type ATPase [Arthrobacter sp. AG1021]|uniref:N-acetylglucosamine kinase n=1 Tax=Arthrobacter sp. AG1021 TaxID=2183908 RepID=UPI000EB42FA9|nr:BadF/BadG/BcrA/BcrD ATPase family protein [Arthrobacter sp. AG1021]RKS18000.1 N-acetylglucosamine kinase-like BadF-type ATPase [Arthrobacter sp. AG1021]